MCLAVSWAHESCAFVALPGVEAQDAEVVSNELNVPEVNDLALLALFIGGEEENPSHVWHSPSV
jgi:hypothetical protein